MEWRNKSEMRKKREKIDFGDRVREIGKRNTKQRRLKENSKGGRTGNMTLPFRGKLRTRQHVYVMRIEMISLPCAHRDRVFHRRLSAECLRSQNSLGCISCKSL